MELEVTACVAKIKAMMPIILLNIVASGVEATKFELDNTLLSDGATINLFGVLTNEQWMEVKVSYLTFLQPEKTHVPRAEGKLHVNLAYLLTTMRIISQIISLPQMRYVKMPAKTKGIKFLLLQHCFFLPCSHCPHFLQRVNVS